MTEPVERDYIAFAPDWKLTWKERTALALTISLNKHVSSWQGATDDELESVAGDMMKFFAFRWDGEIA